MKTQILVRGLCLIIWMMISLIFVCSIIGLSMFIPKDTVGVPENIPSTWYSIGTKLLNSLIN